jgi:hypothetical protein
MTRFLGTTMLAVILATGISCAQQTDSTKCFEIVGTTDYSFGVIEQTGSVEHTYIFKNNCSTTIEVDRAQASCGCTATVLSEKIIPPGGEAKIGVKFTPPMGTRGKVTKTVSVYLKGNQQPHTVLRFTAEVKTDLDIQPQYIQLLSAEVGTPVTGKATIKNVSDKDVEITDVPFSVTSYADTSKSGGNQTVAIPLANAKVSPKTATLKPGESVEIVVSLTPEYKGQVNGNLRIKTAKNESYLQLFGIVRAKGEPDPNAPKPPVATPDKSYTPQGK